MTNELVLIENITSKTFTELGAISVVERLKDIADSVCADVSTKEGVEEIRSMAAAFGKCKAPITDYKKSLTEDFRVKTNAINAQGKFILDNIIELQAKVRKPLTDIENIEKAKKEKAIQEAAEKLAMFEKKEEEERAREAAKIEKEERVKREVEIAKNAAENAKREAKAEFERSQAEKAQQKLLQKSEEDKKSMNIEHRRKIHREILDALRKLPCQSDGNFVSDMKSIITVIAKGEIPNLYIKY